MKKIIAIILLLSTCIALFGCNGDPVENVSDTSADTFDPTVKGILSDEDIYDKILGGHVGQMAGVVYGADVEFHYRGEIMPEEDVVDFSLLNINNAFWQDDLYVEMTFLKVMEENGIDADISLFGQAFANTEYPLDHANLAARENLINGIPAAESGHFSNNLHCEDIDWQIESDFIGLVYGGDPNAAAARAFELGHMICYGDGVYGGVFVAALTAAAFTCETIDEIVDTALSSIPDGTEYKDVMLLVKEQYESGATWEECWHEVESKWGKDDRCITFFPYDSNIDAKLNSAYVLMGLLYGEGDFEKSLTVALRCGQDNDCNPSTVGGVLGVLLGYDGIPEKYKKGVDLNGGTFLYSTYTLESATNTIAQLFKGRAQNIKEGYWFVEQVPVLPVEYEQWAEAPTVTFGITTEKDKVKLSIVAYSVPGIASTVLDFGNGFVTHESVASYRYSAPGEYTVTCTVTDIQGNATVISHNVAITETETVDVGEYGTDRNLAPMMVPICNDTAPTGSGSKDIYIISNGAVGINSLTQYDTYCGYFNQHRDYVGYLFTEPCTVSQLVFTEGMHFENGGWFANGDVKIQVLINDIWTDVELKKGDKYPEGNTMADFGPAFERYEFNFKEITCDGIRIIGAAGGDAGFISVSELEVIGREAGAIPQE